MTSLKRGFHEFTEVSAVLTFSPGVHWWHLWRHSPAPCTKTEWGHENVLNKLEISNIGEFWEYSSLCCVREGHRTLSKGSGMSFCRNFLLSPEWTADGLLPVPAALLTAKSCLETTCWVPLEWHWKNTQRTNPKQSIRARESDHGTTPVPVQG